MDPKIEEGIAIEFGYVDGWEMWKVTDWDFVK